MGTGRKKGGKGRGEVLSFVLIQCLLSMVSCEKKDEYLSNKSTNNYFSDCETPLSM